jgi:sugar lactone lactonase YvrE
MGSVMDVAFSPDAGQRFLYVADGANHHVHILLRDSLEVVGEFGHGGRYEGELGMAHVIASDSKGNLYVGETVVRDRIQRFRYVGMRQ